MPSAVTLAGKGIRTVYLPLRLCLVAPRKRDDLSLAGVLPVALPFSTLGLQVRLRLAAAACHKQPYMKHEPPLHDLITMRMPSTPGMGACLGLGCNLGINLKVLTSSLYSNAQISQPCLLKLSNWVE